MNTTTRKAVIGLGYGDEGKGTVVDYLSSKNPGALVIRYSGGHQAGHTVQKDGIRHVFSNFGSGTLNGNATYISKFCTVDPEGMMKEFDILSSLGIENIDIFVDINTPVTTPYDKYHDVKVQKVLKHSSCGVGVGSTFAREEAMFHLTFGDLFYPFVFDNKLEMIRKHYYKFIGNDDNMKPFLEAVERMKQLCYPTDGIPEGVSSYIFEGSQGLMLDQNIGFFPHVTRSNTGSTNILQMTGNFEPYLVTRAYETRHGNGPKTVLDIPSEFWNNNIVETNVYNENQGEFYCQMLNLDVLKYAITKDSYLWKSKNTLVVTCLDHLNTYPFIINGRTNSISNASEFAAYIGKFLNVNRILINTSAESQTFKEILSW